MAKTEKYWSRISMRVSVSSTDAAHDELDRILPGIARGVANKLGIKCSAVEIEHWLIIHNLEPDDMSIRLKRILRGLYKSWTAYYSLIGVALGGLEQYAGTLTDLFGTRNAGMFLMVAGIIGLVLRFKTTQSLESKGTK